MSELLFSIPDHWEPTTLGDACKRGGGDVQTGPFGSQLHASDYVPSGIPSIMPQNIGDNRISEDGIARITPADAQRLSRYLVRAGDIVYSRRGDVERRALIREREAGWLCGTGCLRVRFGEGIIHPPYAAYYLGHPIVRKWIVRHAQGATMPNLNTTIMSSLPFVRPPLEEQRAIANILGALDDKIELNRRMNETLEAMARAIFQSWFVDFDPVRAKASGEPIDSICCRLGLTPELLALFPDSFEDSELGEIPKGWDTKYFSEAITINPSRTLKKGVLAPYLDMANMPTASARAHEIVGRAFGSGMKFKNGDTLVARITPCLENGKTCFVDFLEDEQVGWGSTEYIVLRPNLPLPPEYGYFLARTEKFRDHAIANMTGTSGRQRVPASAFNDVRMVIPGVEVAKAFGAFVRGTMESMRSRDAESQTLIAMRDSLLPKLLAGELNRIVEIGQVEVVT